MSVVARPQPGYVVAERTEARPATDPDAVAQNISRQKRPQEPAVNYCGFLMLEEARQAKRQLKEHGIDSEILIKDDDHGHEEFWLRARPSDFKAVQDFLGHDDAHGDDENTVLCASCETLVSAADGERCPKCGARIEED